MNFRDKVKQQLELIHSNLNNSTATKGPGNLMPKFNKKEANNIYTLDNRLDHELSFQQTSDSTGEEEDDECGSDQVPTPEKRPDIIPSMQPSRKYLKLPNKIYQARGLKTARVK